MERPERRACLDEDAKENGLIRRVNGRLRKSKTDKEEENEHASSSAVKTENVEIGEQNGKEKQNENNKDDKQGNSSDNEDVQKMRTRRRVNNRVVGKSRLTLQVGNFNF